MYKIISDKNLLWYKPTGIMRGKVIMAYIKGVLEDPDYQAGLLEFIDLSGVSEWQLSLAEIEHVTHFDSIDMSPIKKIAKTGIYAPTDIAFGMARMYQSLAERYHAHICISKQMQEVVRYLGFSMEDLADLIK